MKSAPKIIAYFICTEIGVRWLVQKTMIDLLIGLVRGTLRQQCWCKCLSLLRNKPMFQQLLLGYQVDPRMCQYSANCADVVYGWSLIIPVGFDSRLPPPPPPPPLPPLPLTVRVMLTLLQALLRRLLQLFLVECGVGMFNVLLRSLSRNVFNH